MFTKKIIFDFRQKKTEHMSEKVLYHTLSPEEVLKTLDSNVKSGLSRNEAATRL